MLFLYATTELVNDTIFQPNREEKEKRKIEKKKEKRKRVDKKKREE